MNDLIKIYVKDEFRKPIDTLYTFLKRILNLEDNDMWSTGALKKPTYFDSEYTSSQCVSGKYRSFQDLILISKTYFKVSDKHVAKTIKRFLDENESTLILLCDDTGKWVFQYGLSRSENIKYCGRYNKSNYKVNEIGSNDIYSFIDIIKLMGLTEENIKINN
jgi:hypothetical protein